MARRGGTIWISALVAEPRAAQDMLDDHLFANACGEAEPEEGAFPLPAQFVSTSAQG